MGTASSVPTDEAVRVSTQAAEETAKAADAGNALLNAVPEAAREDAARLLARVDLTPAQLDKALELGGGHTQSLVGLGAALSQCADMAPEVLDGVGEVLCVLGRHLGPISVAAGFLGALVYTFQLSKDQDKNVATVTLWAASVRDWLILVGDRVDRSAAESTLPLFEGLRDEMATMLHQIQKHQERWRFSKMLSSTSFQRDFSRAKASVLELTTVLKAFLDQEAIDLQETRMATIQNAQLDVAQKLDTMDDQLAEIRSLLLQHPNLPSSSSSSSNSAVVVVMDEEAEIYANMQKAAGVAPEAPVKFKDFVLAFECLFLSASDMDPEIKRGLRIAIDRECKGHVTKLDWVKFFRTWKTSNLPMEAHLANLAAEAPPTLCAQVASASAETTARVAHHFTNVAAAVSETTAAKGAAALSKKAGSLASSLMARSTDVK